MNKSKLIISYIFLLLHLYGLAQDNTVDSLKQALKKATHDTTRINILFELIENSSDDVESGIYNDKAKKIAEKLSKSNNEVLKKIGKKGLADAINNNGYFCYNLGNVTEALSYFDESLKILDEIGDTYGMAVLLNNIGAIHRNQGDIQKSLNYYGKSLKKYEEAGDKEGTAISLSNIGIIYEDQGDIPKALDYYEKSLKIMESIGDKKGIAIMLNNIGYVLYNQRFDIPKSIEYFEKSLKIKEEIGDKEAVANSFNNFGSIYSDQKDFTKALKYLEKGLEIMEKIGNKKGIATSLNSMGAIYSNSNNIDKALDCYQRSLKIYEEIGDKMGISNLLNNCGSIYLKQKKHQQALSYATKSLALSQELGYPEIIRNAEDLLTNINLEKGNYTEAFKHYRQYIIFRDSINNESTRKAGIKNQLKYEYEKRAVADSVRVTEEKKVISAKLTAEKTKSYALYGGLILVLIFAGFMFNRFKVTQKQKNIIELKEKETQQQNIIITEQKHLVEEKHKEITDSINYAERIQRSFLATKEVLDENLSDYFVFFKPKDVVSGDFYWASKLNNGSFAMATADSTGHGVPGAIMSLLNITSLEKAIEHHTNPSDILNATRKTIIERLKKDGSSEGGKDGMDCSLTVYDFKNKKLIISAANNPVWINRGTEFIEIKPDKMPVGKHDKQDFPFTQQEIELQKDDIIYTLTDGYPDQFGGEKGKKFMSKNLKELLANNAHLPMLEQKNILEKTFVNWVGDLEQVDDVTIVGIKI